MLTTVLAHGQHMRMFSEPMQRDGSRGRRRRGAGTDRLIGKMLFLELKCITDAHSTRPSVPVP